MAKAWITDEREPNSVANALLQLPSRGCEVVLDFIGPVQQEPLLNVIVDFASLAQLLEQSAEEDAISLLPRFFTMQWDTPTTVRAAVKRWQYLQRFDHQHWALFAEEWLRNRNISTSSTDLECFAERIHARTHSSTAIYTLTRGRSFGELRHICGDYNQALFLLQELWDFTQHPNQLAFPFFNVHQLRAVFEAKVLQRDVEYATVLQWNLCHPLVASVTVMLEAESLKKHLSRVQNIDHKLKWRVLGHRLRYDDAVQLADAEMRGKTIMITNADIAIGEGFDSLKRYFWGNSLMALSRTEVYSGDFDCCCCQDYGGCHDTFVFEAPLPSDLSNLTFRQNTWGAENRVMQAACAAQLPVTNLCYQFRVYHFHRAHFRPSQVRSRVDAITQEEEQSKAIEIGAWCAPSLASMPQGCCRAYDTRPLGPPDPDPRFRWGNPTD